MHLKQKTIAALILITTVITPFTASAQSCAIDLNNSITALIQAQADAAIGDQSEALEAITTVQAELTAIQQRCGASAPFTLSETFTKPDVLSFDYPTGWFAGDFHAGLDWQLLVSTTNPLDLPVPPGASITVSSAEITSAYSPLVALDGVQSATVIIGSPMHIFTELGIYSEAFTRAFLAGNVDFTALVEELQLRTEESPLSPSVELTSIEAERPTVGIEAHADDTSITLVLVALDESQNHYALLVSTATPNAATDSLPLLVAIAATLE